MGKVAFVFSGQGDQFPGMGKDVYEQFPEAKRIFDMCEGLRAGTLETCFNGTEEQLKNTATTQPCLYAVELAYATVIKNAGVTPVAAAGFSLGEIVAAAFSGLYSEEEGFKLVCKRGELMQREAEKQQTFMAAVLKLDEEQLRTICEKYDGVYPVNFNCPGQISVSGVAQHMDAFLADVKAAGGRAIPLKVKGAFHSPLMKEAAKDFKDVLDKVQFNTPEITLYSDLTALPYDGGYAETLSSQICSPVLWQRLVTNMITAGVDEFIEMGPGKTLTNMIKKIDANVRAISAKEFLTENGLC